MENSPKLDCVSVSQRSSSAYQQPLLLLKESFQVGYVLRNHFGGVQKYFTLLTLVIVQVMVDRTQLIALNITRKSRKMITCQQWLHSYGIDGWKALFTERFLSHHQRQTATKASSSWSVANCFSLVKLLLKYLIYSDSAGSSDCGPGRRR